MILTKREYEKINKRLDELYLSVEQANKFLQESKTKNHCKYLQQEIECELQFKAESEIEIKLLESKLLEHTQSEYEETIRVLREELKHSNREYDRLKSLTVMLQKLNNLNTNTNN